MFNLDIKYNVSENFNQKNTLSVSGINPPKIGGGLKFEPNAGIGQKRIFFKGLKTSKDFHYNTPHPCEYLLLNYTILKFHQPMYGWIHLDS